MGDDAQRSALGRRSVLLGLAAVGAIAAVDVAGFLGAGGALTSDTLTPSRFTDGFEDVYGRHDGFRRNHAKGIAATGYFTANGAGSAISTASVFRPGRVPVTGRFSLSGGLPHGADASDTVRGLGLLFDLPKGEQWRTAMVDIPVFPDRTPDGFYERLLASNKDPATGKPDPDRMSAFLARHPETAAAMEVIRRHPHTAGFEDSTFHGLNAFHCTDAAGAVVAVRWKLLPLQTIRRSEPAAAPNYLFDALADTIASGPLHWRMLLTIGQPEDPTDDATTPWPESRDTLDVGTLTLDALQTEGPGTARDITFDPLVLPEGIAPCDDPLLSARSAVYTESFTRRSGEAKQPSAVDAAEVPDER
ncbi:catalase family peroxidase [Rhodococcus sp. NPDC056960]|uniref:catalase family peroxidase n=1 Tax=Rhodococcus sp. NPDC056960 TaxID=3345982 RepID=UPI003625ED6C